MKESIIRDELTQCLGLEDKEQIEWYKARGTSRVAVVISAFRLKFLFDQFDTHYAYRIKTIDMIIQINPDKRNYWFQLNLEVNIKS